MLRLGRTGSQEFLLMLLSRGESGTDFRIAGLALAHTFNDSLSVIKADALDQAEQAEQTAAGLAVCKNFRGGSG